MKDIALKSLVILPLIAFVDYIIMIVVGCTSNLIGSTDNFYECTFCAIGKVVLAISVLAYVSMLIFEVKIFSKNRKRLC
jgi:hypothetical protein